jgi:hypothetical protein
MRLRKSPEENKEAEKKICREFLLNIKLRNEQT